MKKYTYAFVLSLFILSSVNIAFAGGGFEDTTLNPDGTVKTTLNNQSGIGGEVMYDENGNIIPQTAEASAAIKALGTTGGKITLAIVVLLLLGGGYWIWKKKQNENTY